ncbi:MAG: GntR family transcriptional regulator [Gaiellaceae bacterium]
MRSGLPALGNDVPTGASLAEKAYLLLRHRIVTLEMPPGSPIGEDELMHELGMSRTPIREAIIRLAKDGLVTVLPRRQTLVSEVRIGHLAEISEVRAELEAFVAGLAAERFAPGDASELRALLDELEELEELGDHSTLIELDRRVHHFVYRTCRNSLLEEDGSRYYYLSLRIWFLVLDRVARLPEAVREHRELLHALEAGDAAAAREVARRHVTAFEQAIRQVL